MLSIFPELLVYTLAAPLLLRLAAGTLFLLWGAGCFNSSRHALRARLEEWNLPGKETVAVLGIMEIIVGSLLIAGLYTQVVALIGAALAAKSAFLSRKEPFGSASMTVYILVALISLSLALTGPGFFAFDLPL
ncbi:DoxX family membrane protein [Candidatus Parcubacteria bacterium]|nr:DoxX family membrane protein [Candidatus Parcubacteria bacterium]